MQVHRTRSRHIHSLLTRLSVLLPHAIIPFRPIRIRLSARSTEHIFVIALEGSKYHDVFSPDEIPHLTLSAVEQCTAADSARLGALENTRTGSPAQPTISKSERHDRI